MPVAFRFLWRPSYCSKEYISNHLEPLMSDPIPPSDMDAEQALLGSIMIAPYLFEDLSPL